MNPIKHVAIIMDGNGRWGIKHKGSRNFGHRTGLKTVEAVIEESIKEKIEHLTLFTFSTENWKKKKKEINFLFNLLENFLTQSIEKLVDKDIKLKFIGDLKRLPLTLKRLIKISEKKTLKNTSIQINIALNYGSKNELMNTIKIINKKKIEINENNINKNLLTNNIPNPDLLIRTGNTQRLSNFMLWQLAYTEIFFEKKLWPDFKKKDFRKILNKFRNIKINLGSV